MFGIVTLWCPLVVLWIYTGSVKGVGMFTDCGGTVKDLQGSIHTPNFPRPFPLPINCRWILHAPERSKIIIYFTQYFLRHSFHITEYEDYDYTETKNVLGPFNAEEDINSLEVYRPHVTLDLLVTDATNLNLRVEDFLMDVHGFNITYEIVPRKQETKNSCSVHGCSYLGNCLASAHFRTYSCACFKGFYGHVCEKGPYCDPDKGENTCANGGRCRYFYGSSVLTCECPSGYSGEKCENRVVGHLNGECSKDNKCSYRCVTQSGTAQCICKDGFRLESDGFSCKEMEHYRVIVAMPVVEQDHIDEKIQQFLRGLHGNILQSIYIFQLAGLSSSVSFELDSISNESMTYHFYVNKTELNQVNQAVGYLVGSNKFYGIEIDSSRMTIKKEPELKILSVENSDKGPALEGKLLTLTCVARGSDDIQFHWLKDGKPFDMSLTHRNAWEIRLPETISEKQISVLNIDGVTMYDRGRFTCEVTDFGQMLSSYVDLEVMMYPQVEVTPMTISALPGQAQSFRCLSPDDSKPSFTYAWLKDNRPLRDSDDEEVEDLQPSGSRLLVKETKMTSNYTCRVTNKAGTFSMTVYLFVTSANKSMLSCDLNMKHGIKWNKTFGGFFNMQKCPTDHKVVDGGEFGDQKLQQNFLARFGGTTKRRCVCTKMICKWAKPNYSGCPSVHLIKIYHQVMKIQQGYQASSLDPIYRQLYDIAHKARGRMLAGDLDITATILYNIVTTARDFPQLIRSSFDLHEIIDFLNIVLEETLNMTDDEKEDLLTGARVIQIVEMLTELYNHGLMNLTAVQAPKIAMRVQNVPQQQVLEKMRKTTSVNDERIVKRDVTEKVNETKVAEVLSAQYHQSILKVLNVKDTDELKLDMFLSDVVSIVPLAHHRRKNTGHYLVKIPHRSSVQERTHQKKTNLCYSWKRNDRENTDGQWKADSCYTIEMYTNMTKCACRIPGHFTVVTVPVNQTVVDSTTGDSFLVLFVTCILSIICICIGIAIYLASWRYLKHVKHSIHLNFLLSLLGMNITCLMCLFKSDVEVMCISGKVLLQLFVVAAFTFLFLDGVQLFAGVHITMQSMIVKSSCKFSIIGWGVPSLSVICIVFMMELIGYDKQCVHWCFWNHNHHHFYSVLIPIIILIMCHLIVSLLCILVLVKWKDDYHYRKRWKMMLEFARSEFLLILLIIVFCIGSVNAHDQQLSVQVLFLIFDLILVISSVLLLCILKKPIRLSIQYHCCCLALCRLPKENISFFRNFISSNDQQERARAEVEQIHEYCDRIDQERYTSKHKRQLRFILNSGSSSSSSGACCSGPSDNSRSGGTWMPKRNPAATNADSGISEGTESEKSLFHVQNKGRADSSPPSDENRLSQRSKQSNKNTQNNKKSTTANKSKSKHTPSASKDVDKEQESGINFTKLSTQATEIDIEEETMKVSDMRCEHEGSPFLFGLKYSDVKVKSPTEVCCLISKDEEESSKL